MGSTLVDGFERFRLRPFQTSTTYKNLKENGEGVFHITDDVLLMAKAAIGATVEAPTFAANRVAGRVLSGACRYYEFRVVAEEESKGPAAFLVESVAVGRLRDFLGFNRAKHAVIEAAILATRLHILPLELILSEYDKLRIVVAKTAGPDETEAFHLLDAFVQSAVNARRNTDGLTRS